ncbi:MAG: hypothetical protein ACK5MT_22010 [Actinomycetales bacterium]
MDRLDDNRVDYNGVTARLVAAFGSAFTAGQARSLGVGKGALASMVKHGVLTRASWGGYVAGPAIPRRDPPRPESMTSRARVFDRTDPLARVRLALTEQPRYLASHQSALLLMELPTWGLDVDQVHLCAEQSRRRTRRMDVTTHVLPPGGHVVTAGGWPCVDPATAILQVAGAGELDAAVCAADAAVARTLVDTSDLVTAAARWGARPGARAVRELPLTVDARSESAGETRLRLMVRRVGLPVTPQVDITVNGRRYRVDLLCDDVPLILEFDGMSKYSGAAGAQALAAEKQREDDLRRDHALVRFVWRDVLSLDRVRQLTSQGLLEAERRFGRSAA